MESRQTSASASEPNRIANRLKNRPLVLYPEDAIPINNGMRFHDVPLCFTSHEKSCFGARSDLTDLVYANARHGTSRNGTILHSPGMFPVAYLNVGRKECFFIGAGPLSRNLDKAGKRLIAVVG